MSPLAWRYGSFEGSIQVASTVSDATLRGIHMCSSSRILLATVSLLFIGSAAANAESLVLVAGSGTNEGNGPAVEARLKEPFGITFDPVGAMWVAEMVTSNRLLRVDPTGALKVIAANGKGFEGD